MCVFQGEQASNFQIFEVSVQFWRKHAALLQDRPYRKELAKKSQSGCYTPVVRPSMETRARV